MTDNTRSDSRKREYRPATLVECLAVIKGRLSEHLSPAEKRELQEAIDFIGGYDDAPVSETTPLEKANAAIGSRVRMLVNGGSHDLRDSPKSFIGTVERLVREADDAFSSERDGGA